MDPMVRALLLVCTATVSAAVVLIPAAIAPHHRFYVSVVAYAIGACVATYFAAAGLWALFVTSAFVGSSRYGLQPPGGVPSLEQQGCLRC